MNTRYIAMIIMLPVCAASVYSAGLDDKAIAAAAKGLVKKSQGTKISGKPRSNLMPPKDIRYVGGLEIGPIKRFAPPRPQGKVIVVSDESTKQNMSKLLSVFPSYNANWRIKTVSEMPRGDQAYWKTKLSEGFQEMPNGPWIRCSALVLGEAGEKSIVIRGTIYLKDLVSSIKNTEIVVASKLDQGVFKGVFHDIIPFQTFEKLSDHQYQFRTLEDPDIQRSASDPAQLSIHYGGVNGDPNGGLLGTTHRHFVEIYYTLFPEQAIGG